MAVTSFTSNLAASMSQIVSESMLCSVATDAIIALNDRNAQALMGRQFVLLSLLAVSMTEPLRLGLLAGE